MLRTLLGEARADAVIGEIRTELGSSDPVASSAR
jgi:hypothetical protein